MTARHCDVCARPLSPRTESKTLVCGRCRMDGAEFVGAWASDLRDRGLAPAGIAPIVGDANGAAVRRRLSTRRQKAAA